MSDFTAGIVYLRDGEIYGEGRIEILNNLDRIVIPICADEKWNQTAANIVCKQIGFEGAYGGYIVSYIKRLSNY